MSTTNATLTREHQAILGMLPLHVIYAVGTADRPAVEILDRHIIKALEDGLCYRSPFSEAIFELLKSNLHRFYAHFSTTEEMAFYCDQAQMGIEVLDTLPLPQPQRDDFLTALHGLADFVGSGKAFDLPIAGPILGRQALALKELLR